MYQFVTSIFRSSVVNHCNRRNMRGGSVMLVVSTALLVLVGTVSCGKLDFGTSGAQFEREYHGNDKVGRESVWHTDTARLDHQWQSKDRNTQGGLYGEYRQHNLGQQTFRESAIGANLDRQWNLGKDGNWHGGVFAEHQRPAIGRPNNVVGIKIQRDF